MRRKDKRLLNLVKKKKLAPPFQSKVEGGNARPRPDRRARGGRVDESNRDTDLKGPDVSAGFRKYPTRAEGYMRDEEMAAGKWRQKLQAGGRIAEHTVRSQYHGGPQRARTTTTTSRFRDPHPITGLAKGGRLTAGERQSLPSSDFALPGKGKGPKGAGAGSYPIPDESHARNALARVSQHGSSEQKARVRAKVHAKYPGIQVSK